MLTIVIGDHHRLLREAVVGYLAEQSDVAAIFEADSSEQVLDLVCRERPDLVVMDCDLPGRDPFEAVLEIRGINAQCKVLFWAKRPYDAQVEAALACGANGYLLLREPLSVLSEAIREVMRGGIYYSRPIAERIETRAGRLCLGQPRTGPLSRLSEREWELLHHLGYGRTLKQACAAMRISYKAADSLKTSIARKLNIHDRVLLARFAMCQGLVCPGGPSEHALRRLNGAIRSNVLGATSQTAINFLSK